MFKRIIAITVVSVGTIAASALPAVAATGGRILGKA